MGRSGVLVTDGNERATLAVTRSLGRRGIPVYVGAESEGSLAGASRYGAGSFRYPSPWDDPEGYLASLLEAAARWQVAALFPMTDLAMELIGEARARFAPDVALPIPSQEQYHRLSDKYRLTQWAEAEGIPVPRTLYVPDGRIDEALARIEEWPVVVKPGRSLLKADGLWRKSAVQVARDADDLRRLYHEAWYLAQPSMIQQYVTGHGEGVFGLFEDGEPKRLFAHRRLRERPPAGGVSVLREAIALPEPMTEYALRIMRAARWNGIAMVEFKVDPHTRVPYLMEVNGRFWGSLQLAIDAGVDFPWLLYRSATGGTGSGDEAAYRTGTRSQWWLGDLDHVLARVRNPSGEAALPPGTPKRWQALAGLVNPFDPRTHNEVLRLADPVPGLRELSGYAGRMLGAIGRKLGQRRDRATKAIATARADRALRAGAHRAMLAARLPRDARTILVLCKGNICRSPFADRYLAAMSEQRGLGLEVVSAGIEAIPGRTAYPMAAKVAPDFDVALEAHRSQAVSEALVEAADVILVMEPEQEHQLIGRFPAAASKTFLLGTFSDARPVTEIADPYGGTAQAFAECFEMLRSACDGFLVHFEPRARERKTGREPPGAG